MKMNKYYPELNPLEVLDTLGYDMSKFDYITYDKTVQPQYNIIRSCTHDGTYSFVLDLFHNVFRNLVRRTSYYTPLGAVSPEEEVMYTLGVLKWDTTFDEDTCRTTDTMILPVLCRYQVREES